MSSKLREALEELIANIEMRSSTFGLNVMVDTKTFLDAKAALATEQKYEAKWELGAEHEYAYCSHCGHQQWASWDSYREAYENIGEFHKEYKFCPNCGFEMKGANDEQ